MIMSDLLIEDFRDDFHRLLDSLQSKYPALVQVSFSKDMGVGAGETGYLSKDTYFIRLGVPSNWFAKGFLFWGSSEVISRDDVCCMLVGMFHEMEHVKQRIGVYQNEVNGFPYTITELSGVGNIRYYTAMANYKINLNEISAEKNGLLSTFSYLQRPGLCHCSNQEAESMLLNYVNYRVEHSDYFVQPKNGVYTSFDDVIRDFEEAERQAPYQKREYMLLQSKEDLIFQMTCHCNHGRWGIRPEWEPYLDEFWSPKPGDMPVGLYQDMLIASMVNYAKPEAKNLYGALQHVDLSPEHVFGKSFPDLDIRTQDEMKGAYKQNLRMERLHSLEADLPFLQNLDDEISLEKSEDSLEFE